MQVPLLSPHCAPRKHLTRFSLCIRELFPEETGRGARKAQGKPIGWRGGGVSMPDIHADAFFQFFCFICRVSQPSHCWLVALALALGRQKMKIFILLVRYSYNRIQWSPCWKITSGSHFCSLLCLLFLISIRRTKFLSLFLCSLSNFNLLHFPHMQDTVESGSGDLCVNLTVKKIGAWEIPVLK